MSDHGAYNVDTSFPSVRNAKTRVKVAFPLDLACDHDLAV